MRNWIFAAFLLSNSVMAELYIVNIQHDDMASMVMTQNVPLPLDASIDQNGVWGVVEDDTEYTSMYIENAKELVGMSKSAYVELKRTCGQVVPSCIKHILDERGNDQASID